MSGPLVATLVALGLGVVVVRRRSVAIALVSAQSLLLGAGALSLAGEHSADFLVAGLILVAKAGVVPALLVFTLHRTREAQLVAAAAPALARLLAGAVVALVVSATIPSLGLDDETAERGAFALVAVGIFVVVIRRPVLFQAIGLLVAENGIYLLALSTPGGMPFVVDLGVLFDLMLVVSVAIGFTHRIHGEFGTGDSEYLRGLRD
jgi:hydrogenase-4 component E